MRNYKTYSISLLLITIIAAGCSTLENNMNDILGTRTHPSASVPRVAVIDDSATSRTAVVSRLDEKRIIVFQYRSAAAFLADFQGRGFALIICDSVLEEGIGGIDVLKEVRRRTDRPIPFVMVSAYDSEEEMTPALQAGADRVLSKSHLDDLRRISNELLGFSPRTP